MSPRGRSAVAVVFALVALAGCAGGPPTASRSPLAGAVLDLRGFGPVKVDMSVAEARAAAGTTLTPLGGPTAGSGCEFYRLEGSPDGVGLMVVQGRVARVDVIAGPARTAAGVAIGQSEIEAQRRYGGALAVTPHHYTEGGHDLTLVPVGADADYRMVFETDGTAVTAMRAGRLPAVGWVEGCA